MSPNISGTAKSETIGDVCHTLVSMHLIHSMIFNFLILHILLVINELYFQGKLDHIVVHAIGPAITRAMNLALQIKERGNGMFDVRSFFPFYC